LHYSSRESSPQEQRWESPQHQHSLQYRQPQSSLQWQPIPFPKIFEGDKNPVCRFRGSWLAH
jgi:hypothetical protein